jgi:hypothetical protein
MQLINEILEELLFEFCAILVHSYCKGWSIYIVLLDLTINVTLYLAY